MESPPLIPHSRLYPPFPASVKQGGMAASSEGSRPAIPAHQTNMLAAARTF
jgi:hypothetical protein